jgi:eukaryotic-like serine/threonine-protein kinase
MELRSLGKYRLVSQLDVPSESCHLYLVRHEDEPRDERCSYVAKLLQPMRGRPDAEVQRRRAQFEHEIKLLQALNHPCIPTLHAAGEQDGVPYIVMDRVDGADLATLLGHRRGRPRALGKELAVYILGQLTDALHHLHTLELEGDNGPEPLGALHRNLCPQNVMVSAAGDAVLVGFGAACSSWLAREHDEKAIGDLAYTAPERLLSHAPQELGGPATERTDLFAMAVMLWEMLKGQRCLAGDSDARTRENIGRFDIGQSSRRVSGLSPKLSEILRRNLDRDPTRRYTGAYQMLQRLAQSPEAQSAEASRAELAQLVAEVTSVRHE